MSGNGLPAPAAVAHCGRKIASAASFGKCGTPSGALSGQKHHPAARVADEASRKVHGRCGWGGWPRPHFYLGRLFSARILADKLKTTSDGAISRLRTGFLFGTGFRGASTESLRASQLLHKSFCVSLYIRLC